MTARASATGRLAQLREASERCLAEFEAAPAERRDALLERLRLALELRWKIEEQLVIPALGKREASLLLPAAERESNHLRDLAAHGARDAMSSVAGLAALRAERIELALAAAQKRRGFDGSALLRDIDALLERWRGEVRRTGDIEDEESDPVGLPPR